VTSRSRILALCLAALLAAVPARAEEVLVFAAASLTDVLKELGGFFATRTGDRVTFSFGASSDLARQIKAGAPADAFFSADVAQMDQVEQAGLVEAGERRNVLSNTLVVVVPTAAKTAITEPPDLAKLGTLALANPESVPAGVYARTWLQSLGLWDRVKEKVVPALDVRAALAAVQSEHADAAIVYATDAALSRDTRVAYRVPRESGPKIVYVLAPVKASTKTGTRAFTRFLSSPEAAPVYERFGFVVLARP
jgi:molybdate transport system substrate-binding protein